MNVILLLVLFILTSCQSVPLVLTDESVKAPEKWDDQINESKIQPWLKDFNSPILEALVNEGIDKNYALKATFYRIQALQQRYPINRSRQLPDFDVNFLSQLKRTDAETLQAYNPTFNIRWEADIWHRLKADNQAFLFDNKASHEEMQSAYLLLAANIARAWFRIIEANLQRHLAKQSLASYQRSLAAIISRYQRGLITALDVRLAKTDTANAKSRLSLKRSELVGHQYALKLLLGTASLVHIPLQLPFLQHNIPVGLPADLLQRRPDIQAAFFRYQATSKRFDSARKNRLPTIRLTASAGTSSRDLSNLLNWDQLLLNLSAGITQPLFNGGKLKAEQKQAQWLQYEAHMRYVDSILIALSEVNRALMTEKHLKNQKEALSIAKNEARLAKKLAFSNYKSGLINIITLLETERRAFSAESQFIAISHQLLDNRIVLYLALGGSFQSASTKVNP